MEEMADGEEEVVGRQVSQEEVTIERPEEARL